MLALKENVEGAEENILAITDGSNTDSGPREIVVGAPPKDS